MQFKSLYAVFENNGWVRVSFAGLQNDHPQEFSILKQAYLKLQAFEMLDILENQKQLMDELFIFFIKSHEEPIIINKKDKYSKTEYDIYAEQANIPIGVFEEVILATQ